MRLVLLGRCSFRRFFRPVAMLSAVAHTIISAPFVVRRPFLVLRTAEWACPRNRRKEVNFADQHLKCSSFEEVPVILLLVFIVMLKKIVLNGKTVQNMGKPNQIIRMKLA
jgi:hypothetical protein